MTPVMKFHDLTIATEAGRHTYTFGDTATLIWGPVGAGKSSMLEVVKWCLGLNAVLTPVVRSEVRVAELTLTLNSRRLMLRRSLGDGRGTVEVWDAVDREQIVVAPVRQRQDQTTIGNWLLEALEIPRVVIPRSRSRAGSAQTPISFGDVFAYLYCEQQEIDRSVVHHLESFREPKRRAVFELMFNLADSEEFRLETRLGELRDEISRAKQRAETVESFLRESGAGDPDLLRAEVARFSEVLAAATARLGLLRAEVQQLAAADAGLRDELLLAEKEVEVVRDTLVGQRREVDSRQRHLNQLLVDLARDSRTRSAGRRLAPIDFVRCPRCLQSLDREVDAGACYVCAQPDPSVLPPSAFEETRLVLEEQLEEAQLFLGMAETAVTSGELELERRRGLANQLRAALDERTRQFVNPRFEEIASASAVEADARARIEARQGLLQMWSEQNELAGRKAQLDLERAQIELDLTTRRGAPERTEVLDELSNLFAETVTYFQVPWVQTAHIDSTSYLPVVNGEAFENISVAGGIKTAVSVAYSMTLLSYAVAHRETLMPLLLILDTPRKNLGSGDEDKAMAASIYRRLRTLVEATPGRVQIVVADNDVLPEARGWLTELQMNYQSPFVPDVEHPGEEAVESGEVPTVGDGTLEETN